MYTFCIAKIHHQNSGKKANTDRKQQKDDPREYAGLSALNKPLVGDTVVKKDISHDNSHEYGAQKRKAINSKFCVPRFLAVVVNGFCHLLHAALKMGYLHIGIMQLLLVRQLFVGLC